ncbi:NADH-quinone oxidoreductase subunit NuoE [bacterium endosymbiont of Pedicinus badii]|uniref:NADH-quinone oxidoreductase subunit NuoE n=1 Tax=bacterium endosymbiont of Pedicinus badii TaxID=1719126 RepID=UPI0009BB7CDE|nr:NADH-quinone oxidoreductase subunit NuoE [bacterium endosymbiont of Pedicinus badii]OQM34454.1 NADH dehydrogenase [bacterium endosymbiont of Pedicinus badii]
MKKNKNNNYFSENEKIDIEKEKKKYENPRSAVIEVLKIAQKKIGWIDSTAIFEVSRILNISSVEVEEIATFYSQIFRKPVGKNIIRYCDSIVCYIKGYKNILKEIKKFLKINTGETTKDNKFTIIPTCCLGYCYKSPVIMINDEIFVDLNEKKIKKLLNCKKYV